MNACQFLLSFRRHPEDNADALGNKVEQILLDLDFCGRPASIRHEGLWYCAEHYDEVQRAANCLAIEGKWHYFSCARNDSLDKNSDFAV